MPERTSSLVFLHYLTTVFDNITDAIFLVGIENKRYRLLLANEAFSKFSGYSPDSIGKFADEFITDAESFISITSNFKKVIDTKKPVEYFRWANVPLGRQAYQIKYIPILNAVGECVQIVGITRNITEALTLQDQYEQERTNAAALAATMVSPAIIVDKSLTLYQVPKETAHIATHGKPWRIGQNLKDLLEPTVLERLQQGLRKTTFKRPARVQATINSVQPARAVTLEIRYAPLQNRFVIRISGLED